MELFLYFLNTCWFRHIWSNRRGNLTYIRSNDRHKRPGEVLFKNPDGGWYRHERHCIRCGHRQYLCQLDTEGKKAKWENL